MITKGQIVQNAQKRMSITGCLTGATPDQTETMLMLLEDMALNLGEKGYPLGYKAAVDGYSIAASDDSGIAAWMMKGISCALAVESASAMGLIIPAQLYEMMNDGLATIATSTQAVQPAPFGLPMGSANGIYLFDNDNVETLGEPVNVLTDGDQTIF